HGKVGHRLSSQGDPLCLEMASNQFSRRSAAAAEAVTDVEKSPGQEVNWQVLRAQLAKALTEDEAFRRELAALVAQHAPATSQKASVTGDQNVVVQIHGSGNAMNVQR